MSPIEILALLGVRAVLLPIREGTKAPNRARWQRIKFMDTRKETYQVALAKAPAIGVSQGEASEGLCSIDCDDDAFLEEIIALNPILAGTLRTAAKRGGNLWFVLKGPPPRSRKLTRAGRAAGEFRSTGNQTLIAGKHPEGMPYRIIVQAKPVRIDYLDLRWPQELPPPSPSLNSSPYSTTSPSSTSSPPLHPLYGVAARFVQAEKARKAMERNPSLGPLYRTYIARTFTPSQGSRNSDLIAMVSFLFRAVGEKQLIALVTAFHQLNQDVFVDSLEQHVKELQAHLSSCREGWVASLSPEEASVARALAAPFPECYLEAYRICRDLASINAPETPTGMFFLSCQNLGVRLGVDQKKAHRILRTLESGKLMEAQEKGTRYAKEQKARATRYKWAVSTLIGETRS